MSESTLSKDAVVIERIFDSPVEVIWQMWTQPEHFKHWYGPRGFTVPVAEMDVRIGGKHLFCMESPDGSMKMWSTGEYLEIVPNKRLVYTDSMADEHGNVVTPPANGMNDDYPETTKVTVLLEDLNGRTKMVVTHAGISAEQGATEAWGQAFDKMVEYVETGLTK
jgi:uncharacterized protein YndB with AHSA1/START domain